MTTAKFAAAFLLFSLCILTGCGGMNSTANPPVATVPPSTPPPTTPTPATPPPPSFPTQFMFTADSADFTIRGFKINADGSLTAVSGSPFTGQASYAKAVGTSLVGGPGIKLYSVNSSTGTIQLQENIAQFPGVIVPDLLPTVFHANDAIVPHFPPLDTYSIANGKITLLQGFFAHFPDTTDILAVDPTGSFIYGAEHSARDISIGPYTLAVLSRNQDGTIGKQVNTSGPSLCPEASELSGAAVMVRGKHTFLYHTCDFAGQLGYNEIDNSNGSVLNSGNAPTVSGVPSNSLVRTETMTVDPSGSFLLLLNSKAGSLDVYTIDPNTGVPGPAVNRFQTGNTPRSVLVDSTGQYVYLLTSHCGLDVFPSQCNDQSTIFAYRMIGGNLSPLPVQSYPAGIAAHSLTVVKF